MADLSGKTLGKYQMIERLGRGGMATVYRAYQAGIDRFVAVKVVHEHLSEDDPQFIERFRREARAVGALRHPNIVQVIDFDVQDGQYFMVMEYLEGETLKARLAKDVTMRPLQAAQIIRKLCDAVAYAHEAGMLHRDIKPANVIFAKRGEPILTDFGIAKLADSTNLTASGAAVGTPVYMSPEAGRGEKVDERTDVYSLGVVLYEMLAGKPPFDADTPYGVILKHIEDPLPPLRSSAPNVPAELEAIVLRALAKKREDRYQTAAEMRDALVAFEEIAKNIASTQVSADTPLPDSATAISLGAKDAATAVKPKRDIRATPNRTPVIVAGVLAIIIIGVLIVALSSGRSGDTASTDLTGTAAVVSANATQVANATALIQTATVAAALAPTQAAAEATEAPTNPPATATSSSGATSAPTEAAALASPAPTEGLETRVARSREKYGSLAATLAEHIRNGNFEVALELAQAELAKAPNEYDLQYLTAAVLVQFRSDADKLEEGKRLAERAIQSDPERSEAYIPLGIYYHFSPIDDRASAIREYTKAIERDSRNPDVYYLRSLAYPDTPENFQAKLDDLGMTLQLNPNYEAAYHNRAELYFGVSDLEKSERDWQKWYEVNPEPWKHPRLAWIYLLRGKKQQALAVYETFINKELPNDPDYLAEGAFVAWQNDNSTLSDQWAQLAVALEPTNATANYMLALLANSNGDYAKARELLEVTAQESERWRFEDYFFTPYFNHWLEADQARVLRNEGRLDEAIAAFEKAKQLTSDWVSPYYEQAQVYAALGKIEEARSTIRDALELDSVKSDVETRALLLDFLAGLNLTPTAEASVTPTAP